MKWTQEQLDLLREYYPDNGTDEYLIKKLGRKRKAISLKAYFLGIKYLGKKKGCFNKGNIPYNLGKKRKPETIAKMSKTFFKKGNKPHNTKHDYAVSFWKDISNSKQLGYWYIRLGLSNWQPLHREIYKNVHNVELSNKDMVYFIDGDSHNVHPDNLGLRTRLEHAIYNSPNSNQHPELIETKILLAKINKKIKENAKK
jgi:hypothetical protein